MARKILLADDSVTAQNMGRRILTDAGYEVVTVNNGSAALKKIAELKPELVVLDVYMPGYSGLEVCQRIKASADTAAIPILLTVGKLEPFKAEEAKKVFADAFIVKPFEATELLAILSKLEDKIVPAPAARSGKSAPVAATKTAAPKPGESAEAQAKLKGRLRIQEPAAPKVAPVEQPSASAFHDIRHEVAVAEEIVEEPNQESIARNLPGNVTSEELAAITAAVAAFTSRSEEDFASGELTVVEPEEKTTGEAAADPIEAALAKRPPTSWEEAVRAHEAAFAELDAEREREEKARQEREQEALAQEVSVEQASVEQGSVEQGSEEGVSDLPAELSTSALEVLPSVQLPGEPGLTHEMVEPVEAFEEPIPEVHESAELMAIEQEVTSSIEGAGDGLTEFEVNAALASLAPLDAAEDIMSQLQAAELAHDHTIDRLIDAPPAAWTVENADLGSAKWIAHEVGLEQSEAALILEEEMQKVLSALALNVADTTTDASFGEDSAQNHAGAIAPEVVAATNAIDAGIAADEVAAEDSYQSYAVASSEVVDQEVSPVDTVTPNLAMENSEPEQVSNEPEAAVAEPAESQPAVEAVSQEAIPVEHKEAFAAAASANTGLSPAFVDTPIGAPPDESRTHQGGNEQDAELAAAWARWRQIRESVASPQFVSQVADVATAEIEEAQRQQLETAAPGTNGDASAAPVPPTSDAIASIVDSVLAQLKPKLVEEIAKQLSERNK